MTVAFSPLDPLKNKQTMSGLFAGGTTVEDVTYRFVGSNHFRAVTTRRSNVTHANGSCL